MASGGQRNSSVRMGEVELHRSRRASFRNEDAPSTPVRCATSSSSGGPSPPKIMMFEFDDVSTSGSSGFVDGHDAEMGSIGRKSLQCSGRKRRELEESNSRRDSLRSSKRCKE